MAEIYLPEFNPHPAQERIIQERKRFNVVKCGRRFGKSEMSQELAIYCLDYGLRCAYFAPTYKDAHEWWEEIKSLVSGLIAQKNEQVKQIVSVTGGLLDVWSMEDPNSGRGRKYHRAIMDECEKAPKFKESWTQAIRPTLADYQGDAWFFSTPKFGKTYFKEIFEYHKKFDNWAAWSFTTYDNPHISKDEIDQARSQYDDLTFRCEFMAEDVDLSANPFAYSFDQNKHVTAREYDATDYLHVSMDFNVDPITAIAGQYIDGEIRILREFRLSNSNIYELCDSIKAAFPTSVLIVTGDASGRARSALTTGNINYYTVVKQKLELSDGQLKVPTVNPAISDSRVLTNSLLQNFNVTIDPSCKFLIDDLKYVEVNSEGDIDKTKDKHRSHLLDCFRYLMNTFHRDLLKIRTYDYEVAD